MTDQIHFPKQQLNWPQQQLMLTLRTLRESQTEDVSVFGCYEAIGGRLLPNLGACSNECAICRTPKSSRLRPTICNPTGNPSGVNPQGTEAAGFPVAEIYQQDFIQSIWSSSFVSPIDPGYGVVTSKGGPCVVGKTK